MTTSLGPCEVNGKTCFSSSLPRILYIGQVPIEAGLHGSVLLYRLLYEYPPERLMIVEGRKSIGFERLHGVRYETIRKMRFVPSRWPQLWTLVQVIRSRLVAAHITALTRAFCPQAVLTVTDGCEWITALRVAKNLSLPIHLISHDDWEATLPLPSFLRGWVRNKFRSAYRDAASRLCVSPYMAKHYEQQYGACGTVLLPSRAKDIVSLDGPPAIRPSTVFTIGYAGSIHAEGLPALHDIMDVLESIGGRLLIFSQITASNAKAFGLLAPHVTLEPTMASAKLIHRLRRDTDALFLGLTDIGLNSRICFPSKLVDYSATGLPIIASAPYSSALASWVRENPFVAELVNPGDSENLRRIIVELANEPNRRCVLGSQAQKLGNAQFDYTKARDTFFAAVTASELCQSAPVF